MNFQIYILLSVVACALALPLPDEEVSILQKVTETSSTVKPTPTPLSSVENGTKVPATNATEKPGTAKPVDETKDTIEDEVPEAPKSLPVKAREEIEPVVPVSEAKTEPKETVEVGESKSTASSPGPEDSSKKNTTASKTDGAEANPSTESTSQALEDKKNEVTTAAPKPSGTNEANNTPKPEVAGEIKTENSITKVTEAPKPNSDNKPTEVPKEKHDHSSDKSDESGESKESEESKENKSK